MSDSQEGIAWGTHGAPRPPGLGSPLEKDEDGVKGKRAGKGWGAWRGTPQAMVKGGS